MKREKGDRFRPIATIEKMKGDIPSVLTISGRRYIWDASTRAISKKGWKDRDKYTKG